MTNSSTFPNKIKSYNSPISKRVLHIPNLEMSETSVFLEKLTELVQGIHLNKPFP